MALITPIVELIGDEALTNSIIDRSITELQDNLVSDIASNAFNGCASLKTVHFETAISIQSSVFEECASLEKAVFP